MRLHLCILALLVGSACSDPTGNNDPAQLIIEGGAERSIRIGTIEPLRANVTGNGGDGVIRWTTSDASIARVDENGVLRLATSYSVCSWVVPGECQVRLTARSGDLVAFQTLIVMPFVPTLELSADHLDVEAGDSARIHARVLLENNPVPWCTVAFASRDSAIAAVGTSSGLVRGFDLGSTIVDVSVSGVLCPGDAAQVTVTNRPPLYTLAILPNTNVVASGSTLQLQAIVTNRKEVSYSAIAVQWSTSDASIVSVNSGLVRAGSCPAATVCRAVITARSGRLVATLPITVVGP